MQRTDLIEYLCHQTAPDWGHTSPEERAMQRSVMAEILAELESLELLRPQAKSPAPC